MSNKQFTAEFKPEAVKLLLEHAGRGIYIVLSFQGTGKGVGASQLTSQTIEAAALPCSHRWSATFSK